MNNKEKLISVIDKDFNKNSNLNIIFHKIDKSYKFNNRLKYAFVPTLILVFSIIFGLSINEKEISLEDNNNNNLIVTSQNIIINDVNIPIFKNDSWEDSISPIKGVKYKVIESIEDYDFYKDLNISDEYNAFIMYEVDVKIYKSDNIYISVFKYDNINFNITTCNLEQSELLDLLKEVIK